MGLKSASSSHCLTDWNSRLPLRHGHCRGRGTRTCISWPTELSAALTKRSTLSDVVFGHFRLLGSLGTPRQSYRRGFHQNHPLYMFNHGIENLDPLKKPVSS